MFLSAILIRLQIHFRIIQLNLKENQHWQTTLLYYFNNIEATQSIFNSNRKVEGNLFYIIQKLKNNLYAMHVNISLYKIVSLNLASWKKL